MDPRQAQTPCAGVVHLEAAHRPVAALAVLVVMLNGLLLRLPGDVRRLREQHGQGRRGDRRLTGTRGRAPDPLPEHIYVAVGLEPLAAA